MSVISFGDQLWMTDGHNSHSIKSHILIINKMSSSSTASSKAAASQLVPQLNQKRLDLNNMWKPNTIDRCAKKWNEWSPAVRQDFLKRGQNAITAVVQSNVAKGARNQWTVTLKFVMTDVFEAGQATCDKSFSEKGGMKDLLDMIADGREKELNAESFSKKIDEMLQEMKPGMVAGFDSADKGHKDTLRTIRSMYACDWCVYLCAKMLMA